MNEKTLLKDELFNPIKVELIASEIEAVYSDFKVDDFLEQVIEEFPKLELKERIYHITSMLQKHLPDDYKRATNILLNSLPPPLDSNKTDGDFGDFIYAPYAEYIKVYGCNKIDLEFSLKALQEISQRFSVEFAIRDFINHFPDETLNMLKRCSLSPNYHLRRLASEGLRPKLPWAKKLTIDYNQALIYLDNLYSDPTRYVTRSVANHLNDISKINPPLVITTLKKWKKSNRQNPKEMAYIITHSLRTLIKQGNTEALELLGYKREIDIKIYDFALETDQISIGESLIFSFIIKAKEESNLMIDYIIDFKTKTKKESPKVYKIKKLTLPKNKEITIKKSHPFRANMTTRKLIQGEHHISLQINGKIYYKQSFLIV